MNSHFPLKMQKFSPVDVFPYMVYRFGIFAGMSSQYNIPGNTVLSDTYVHIRMQLRMQPITKNTWQLQREVYRGSEARAHGQDQCEHFDEVFT